MPSDPTERFTDRVDSYVASRPGYPAEVLDLVRDQAGLDGPFTVADVGSGTGIFSRLLLERGAVVYAVEPNRPMRTAAESASGAHPRFHSLAGRAEATTLPDASVDLVTAAQAFHWFDPAAARREWLRILRRPAWALLVWNERLTEGEPFLAAFERFTTAWGTDYRQVRRAWVRGADMASFFGAGAWNERVFPNAQSLDREGLIARVASSSYMPSSGPRHRAMSAALDRLFDDHQRDGRVTLVYETRVYLGRLVD